MFKKIESTESNTLPFFNVWQKTLTGEEIKELIDHVEYALSVKEAISGKGFFLTFTRFSIFIWKNSTHGKYCESLFELESSERFAIQLKATRKGLDYDIGTDEEELVYHKLNKPEEDTIIFLTKIEKMLEDEEKNRTGVLRKAMNSANKEISKKTMDSLKAKQHP